MDNEMTLTFLARSENEGLARLAVTSFMAQLDPTIEALWRCWQIYNGCSCSVFKLCIAPILVFTRHQRGAIARQARVYWLQ